MQGFATLMFTYIGFFNAIINLFSLLCFFVLTIFVIVLQPLYVYTS